ncbi:Chemotaxis response regulator protein-glutamate methylesterase 1, partial [Clarias magur]
AAVGSDRSRVMEETALSGDHVLHVAVCSLRDAEPGGRHLVVSERSARQLAGGLST